MMLITKRSIPHPHAAVVLVALAALVAPRPQPAHADTPPTPAQKDKIEAALPQAAFAEPPQPRRILVVSRTAGFRHKSIPHGKFALEAMGARSGAFEAVISDDPANFERQALAGFDAVVLLNVSKDFFMPDKRQRKGMSQRELAQRQAEHDRLISNLVEFVRDGGGVAGIHAATDACYKHPEYPEMIGGLFWGHPWNARHRVVIDVEDPDHALNRPVFGSRGEFELVEEIYQFREEPYSRQRLRILLALDKEKSDPVDESKIRRSDGDFPVAWVQRFGDGRIFYSSLGHNAHIYWNPLVLKHYLAGIQFAIGDLEADTTPSSASGSATADGG